jgi:hypothetical protein
VETALWLPAFENRSGDVCLFRKDPADQNLKLLFSRQHEKRGTEAENKTPSERVGNRIE